MLLDKTKQQLQVGKYYRVTWKFNYCNDVVYEFYVAGANAHKVQGTGEVYTWSYDALFENKDSSYSNYYLCLWNSLGYRFAKTLTTAFSIEELQENEVPNIKFN